MFDFEVGDLVELTIDRKEGWEPLTVRTTIAGILKRPSYTEYRFPIVFNLCVNNNEVLEGESGFVVTNDGRTMTNQHSCDCIVEDCDKIKMIKQLTEQRANNKDQGGRRPC